jgi:hypothetical protein
MLRTSLVVRQLRFRQWLILIERQFARLIELLGIFVGEQFIGKLISEQRIIEQFLGPIQQYSIE